MHYMITILHVYSDIKEKEKSGETHIAKIQTLYL